MTKEVREVAVKQSTFSRGWQLLSWGIFFQVHLLFIWWSFWHFYSMWTLDPSAFEICNWSSQKPFGCCSWYSILGGGFWYVAVFCYFIWGLKLLSVNYTGNFRYWFIYFTVRHRYFSNKLWGLFLFFWRIVLKGR